MQIAQKCCVEACKSQQIDFVGAVWVSATCGVRVWVDAETGVSADSLAGASRIAHDLMTAELGDDVPALQVTTPGRERPLFNADDFIMFEGRRAQISLRENVNGRRRLVGRIGGYCPQSNTVSICDETANEQLTVSLESMTLGSKTSLFPLNARSGPIKTPKGGHKKAELRAAQAWLDGVVQKHPVVMLVKSYCPYSRRALRTLRGEIDQIRWSEIVGVYALEDRPDAAAVQAYCGSLTGASTVPRIFIDGTFIGGADELEQLQAAGTLDELLAGIRA